MCQLSLPSPSSYQHTRRHVAPGHYYSQPGTELVTAQAPPLHRSHLDRPRVPRCCRTHHCLSHIAHSNARPPSLSMHVRIYSPINDIDAGFEYATYNDVEDLKRVVKRINRRGKIRSLFGRPRRAVAAIMMEALQVVFGYILDEILD